MKLSTFYGGMIVLVLAGGGAMWYASRQSADTAAPVPTGPIDTTTIPAYTMGSPNAPVQIIQYADFECPGCGRYAVLTEPDVRERMIQTGQVRVVFRDRMINGHGSSPTAHLAAACAAEQNKFWEMHDQLYFHQGEWSEASGLERKFRGYAEAIRLDMDRYNTCMSQQRYAARIAANTSRADSAGFTQTPTFLINGHVTIGAIGFDSMKVLVDKYAAEAARAAPAKSKSKAPSKS
jgi:protein-disulfide isomerase